MNTKELVRMESVLMPPPKKLAEEASSLLDYNVISLLNKKEEHKITLFNACVAAKIKPFTAESVGKYKKSKTGMIPSQKKAIGVFLSGALISAIAATVGFTTAGFALEIIGGVITLVCLMACAAIMSERRTLIWDTINLSSYHKEIPLGVIEKALALKQELNDVHFKVDYLRVRRSSVSYDPFLVAIYKDAKYYIAVWEEPGFDAEYE